MADQPQDQYDGIIFDHFDGLKNTVTRERLKPTELEVGLNIDIDDAGQPHSRRGYVRKDTANYHSVKDLAGIVYVVKNGDLGILYPDYSFELLKAGVGSEPLSYTEAAGKVFFSSSMASGIIDGLTVEAWGQEVSPGQWVSPVMRPSDTLGLVGGRLYKKPPLAEFITYYNGRIYLAQDEVVWATELWAYKLVDATASYLPFEAKVTGLGAVTDGVFVGTSNGVYFCGGKFPLKRMPLSGAAVVPGSMLQIPAELIRPQLQDQQSPSRNAVLMLTSDGLMAGFDSGELMNLTQPDFLFPEAQRAVAMFRKLDGVNQYVVVADSGGTPADTARIGDHVDVEIRRFQGA